MIAPASEHVLDWFHITMRHKGSKTTMNRPG